MKNLRFSNAALEFHTYDFWHHGKVFLVMTRVMICVEWMFMLRLLTYQNRSLTLARSTNKNSNTLCDIALQTTKLINLKLQARK